MTKWVQDMKCMNIAPLGCYPCLYCLAHHKNLVTPLSVRGQAPPRTFETICADHQHYIASGVDKKEAQHFYNCITEPIFNIPISQVSIDNLPRTELFCMITHTCTCMCALTC